MRLKEIKQFYKSYTVKLYLKFYKGVFSHATQNDTILPSCNFVDIFTDPSIFVSVLAENEKEEEDYINDDYEEGDQEDEEDEESYTGPPPIIHSKARELSVKPGENVRFPCEVEHAGTCFNLENIKKKIKFLII